MDRDFKKVTCYYNDEGFLHREDGPAVEHLNGDRFWYINGKLHRVDGPAVEYVNGSKIWFLNGMRQYSIDMYGTQAWYKNDKLHKEDGPAIVSLDNGIYWYLNGRKLTFNTFLKKVNLPEEKLVALKLEYGSL